MKRFAGRGMALALVPLLAVALGAACLAAAPGNARRSLAAKHQHSSAPSKGHKGRSVEVANNSASRRTVDGVQGVADLSRNVAAGSQLASRPIPFAPHSTSLVSPPLRL
jgi:hypothetical protein